jgi:hypothetical protein
LKLFIEQKIELTIDHIKSFGKFTATNLIKINAKFQIKSYCSSGLDTATRKKVGDIFQYRVLFREGKADQNNTEH